MTVTKEDINRLKEIFITREECTESIRDQNRKFSNDDKRLTVAETYQKINLWLLAAVSGGVITMLVKMFFGRGFSGL